MTLKLGIVLAFFGLFATACPSGGRLENSELFEPGFCDAPKLVFEASCGGVRCHEGEGGDPPDGGLELFGPGLGARVLAAEAAYPDLENDGCPAEPEPMVDVNDVDRSLLLRKLNGTQTCGDAMPPVGAGLPESEILCVRRWLVSLIEAGAAGGAGGAGGGGVQ